MFKKVLFSALLVSQTVFAGNIDRIASFKLERLNKLVAALSDVASYELTGNCGSVGKVTYSDDSLQYAAIIASISGEYTEDVGASPSDFDEVKATLETLVGDGEKEAKLTSNKVALKLIAEARSQVNTIDLLDEVNVYVGASSGAFSSSHSHFVILDYVNKEVFSFSDGYCE